MIKIEVGTYNSTGNVKRDKYAIQLSNNLIG
jgi:hypothetical protein